MTTVHDAAKRLMDTSIERGQWDELPMLGLFVDLGDEAEPALILMMVEGHPADFMNQLAATVPFMPEDRVPLTPLLGLVLFSEGWALIEPKERLGEVKAMLERGERIADHPDRVEIKSVAAYDGEHMSSLQLKRGDTEAEALTETIEGTIPDAMATLFKALNDRVERRGE